MYAFSSSPNRARHREFFVNQKDDLSGTRCLGKSGVYPVQTKRTFRSDATRIPNGAWEAKQETYVTRKPKPEPQITAALSRGGEDTARLDIKRYRSPVGLQVAEVPAATLALSSKCGAVPGKLKSRAEGADAPKCRPLDTCRKEKTRTVIIERPAKDGRMPLQALEVTPASAKTPQKSRTGFHQAGPNKPNPETKTLCSLKDVPDQPFERFFRDKVVLKGVAISKNSAKLNNEVAELLRRLRMEDARFAFNILNTGSYYEGLKVLSPSEFDIMLVFENDKIVPFFQVSCPTRGNHVGYAQLKFKDHKERGRGLWGEFLTSDGKYLSPGKIRRYFSCLLEKVISCRRGVSLVKQSSGPAVTIKIDCEIFVDLVISVEVPGWPGSANGWGDHASQRTWPLASEVALLKRSPDSKFHLVAKPCKRSGCKEHECQTYWRLSFSAAEKHLLRKKGCEKKCYRVVKAIFEAHEDKLKPPLCTYYLKTLFLHRRRENRHQMKLGEDVIRFFQHLVNRLNNQSTQNKLPHFFIQRLDLLAGKPEREIRNVADILWQIIQKLRSDPSEFLCSLPL